jgi:hypothetical protein
MPIVTTTHALRPDNILLQPPLGVSAIANPGLSARSKKPLSSAGIASNTLRWTRLGGP